VITQSGRVGNLSSAVQSDRVIVSSTSSFSPPTTGSVRFVLFGSGMGDTAVSIMASIAGSSCETSSWISDTAVGGKVSAGSSHSLSTRVSFVLSNSATLSLAISFARPRVSSIKETAPSSGAVYITVTGSMFSQNYATSWASVGGTAVEQSAWVSFSSLIGKVSAGQDSAQGLMISVGLLYSVSSLMHSYTAPSVLRLVSSCINCSNLPISGAAFVSVLGAGFSTHDSSALSTFAGSAEEASQWLSSSTILSKVSSGLLRSGFMMVSIGLQKGSRTMAFGFDAPIASSIAMTNGPVLGATLISVTGRNLGVLDSSLSAKLAATVCTSPVWTSDSASICVVSRGTGARLDVSVTVAQQVGTLTEAFTYNHPVIFSVFPVSSPTTAQTRMFVGGVNFGGFNAAPVSIRIGGTQVPSVSVISDALLTFINTPGVGIQKSVRLEVDSLVTEISMAFTYFAPAISSMRQLNVPMTGSVSITILGSNMGTFNSSLVKLSLLGSNALHVKWISDTCVTSLVSSHGSFASLVTVSVSNQIT